ncbi:DinB family protein [Aquimarina sp. 2304DJ70-9]|uniref:DinB family protein n=1 Tax=Aquimarina penaris TaxID=3231044 RepID=UPI0034634A16
MKNQIYLNTIPDNEYSQAISYYSNKSYKGETLTEVFENTTQEMISFIKNIPKDKFGYRYGSGKWTIREVIQHIISYEQIMSERAQIVAGRNIEQKHTIYYNQSTTVAPAKDKTKIELLEEFRNVRTKTQELFENFSQQELIVLGTLDGFKTSVRMIGMCISGHQKHHFEVIKERYL